MYTWTPRHCLNDLTRMLRARYAQALALDTALTLVVAHTLTISLVLVIALALILTTALALILALARAIARRHKLKHYIIRVSMFTIVPSGLERS